jgi:hypothetical protein
MRQWQKRQTVVPPISTTRPKKLPVVLCEVDEPTLAITAHHEAAHVVTGLRIPLVDIEYDGSGSKGRVLYRNNDPERLLGYDKIAITTLAGRHGQRRFAPRSQWYYDSRSDHATVRSGIRKKLKFTGKRAEEKFAELDELAAQAVADNWHDITKVAAALLQKRTLTADEVRKVLRWPVPKWKRTSPIEDRGLIY